MYRADWILVRVLFSYTDDILRTITHAKQCRGRRKTSCRCKVPELPAKKMYPREQLANNKQNNGGNKSVVSQGARSSPDRGGGRGGRGHGHP